MNHSLKINPEYLENLISGIKKNEIRFNDRDYQNGDTLEFNINNPDKDPNFLPPSAKPLYEKHIQFKITHIHSGLGMKDGYIVLSLDWINED